MSILDWHRAFAMIGVVPIYVRTTRYGDLWLARFYDGVTPGEIGVFSGDVIAGRVDYWAVAWPNDRSIIENPAGLSYAVAAYRARNADGAPKGPATSST